ncbi:hypothetical protein So717_37800 [Roseobacter cerasinus]|uniref:Valyl-tRNA synthetase n=1 Tax=Roseobacter cerasinus TaxID=2602289 RepID=A0A640VVY4_9RHOB|nr:hypothetical protein [Roseobacter cerasinus]GFE52027.1 hypothetical protein So717_37800 [Roseobacter cerasinus]
MVRFILAAALAVTAAPALAETEKEVSCGYQAEVVAAIRQARLDRVKERDVEKTVLAGEPSWPENFNNAIPLVTPWIYEMPRKDVRDNDLAAVWKDACLAQ